MCALFDRNLAIRDDYIILNESRPKITVINLSRVQKVKGEILLQFIAIFSVFQV